MPAELPGPGTLPPTYDHLRSYEENRDEGPFFSGPVPRRKIPSRRVRFLGFPVNSPVGIAAGPLLDSKWIALYAKLGFDILTYKTVRTREAKAHSLPNILFLKPEGQVYPGEAPLVASSERSRYPVSITNSFGMPSWDPERWIPDVRKARASLREGQLLSVSVVGSDTSSLQALASDYARCAELAFDAGAHLIELNLSCPNVHGACASVYLDPESAEAVSRAVRGAVGKQKVLVKLGYYEERPRLEMVLRAVLPHVDGIAAINTVSRPVRSPDGKVALPGRERSGICGAAIRSAALGTVEQLCSLREKLLAEFAVVGVGGIMTPADAMAHLRVGADAVMMATAPMYDPYLAMRLHEAGDWPARR